MSHQTECLKVTIRMNENVEQPDSGQRTKVMHGIYRRLNGIIKSGEDFHAKVYMLPGGNLSIGVASLDGSAPIGRVSVFVNDPDSEAV